MTVKDDELYYLDAGTKDKEFRLTTFSFLLEDLIRDFREWLLAIERTFDDVGYAVICRADDQEVIADLVSGEGGEVVLQPRKPDKRLSHRLVLWFRRIRNRF